MLEWIIKRCEDKVGAKETEIGYVPYADDINLEELDYEIEPGRKFTKADLESILTVEKDYWLDDFNSVKEFYAKIGDTIPAELTKQQTLQQASTAILSQANQLPSAVMKLLQ